MLNSLIEPCLKVNFEDSFNMIGFLSRNLVSVGIFSRYYGFRVVVTRGLLASHCHGRDDGGRETGGV